MTPMTSNPPGCGRLTICDRAAIPDAVDGAWWPRTGELAAELPDLVAVIGRLIGPVARVVYDPSVWGSAPSRIIHRNHAVPVDPYRLVSRDTIYLVGTHSRDALLYVIAASAPAAAARSVLDAVATARDAVGVALLRRVTRAPLPVGDRPEGEAL